MSNQSTASIAGHPIHPMLVTIPIGLWIFSFVSDLIFLYTGNPSWSTTALYTMGGGIVGALLAAVPGLIDLFNFDDRETRRIGIIHMAINLTVVALFVVNLVWRLQTAPEARGPVWLSLIAILLLAVSGWLGGEMVYVHRAGMSDRADRR